MFQHFRIPGVMIKKKKFFDIKKTNGNTGIFPEYILDNKNSTRTKDPMFSFAVFGKNKQYFTKIGKNTFGENSVYEKLHKKNAKLKLYIFNIIFSSINL